MLNTTKLEKIIEKFGKDEPKLKTNLESERLNVLMEMDASSGFAPKFVSFKNFTGTDLLAETQGLDTSNLTSMQETFYGCSKITKVDMSGWNLENVTTMQNCFAQNTALSEVIGPKTEANKLTTVTGLFSMCKALKRVDFKDFKINGLTSISSCFRENEMLEYADLSGWSGELTSAGYFANHCTKLKFLDIRNLTFNKVTDNYSYVFNNMPSDCLIIVKDSKQKSLVSGNFSASFTNIKTVEEYIAEGGE